MSRFLTQADAIDRDFTLTVTRRTDGVRAISVTASAEDSSQDATYSRLVLVRKLREYPLSYDGGFSLLDTALTSSALSTDFFDDNPVEEGETIYYSLFAYDQLLEWNEKASAEALTNEQKFDEVSSSLVPRFVIVDDVETKSSGSLFKKMILDVTFGEIESLIKQLADSFQYDPETSKSQALDLLFREIGWNLGPEDRLEDARELFLDFKEHMRSRGTESTEDFLLTWVTHCPIKVRRGVYFFDQSAGYGDETERLWEVSLQIEPTGGGPTYTYASTLEVEQWGLAPFSLAAVIGSDTYVDDGAGVVEDSTGTPVGTVDYITGAFTMTVTSDGSDATASYRAKVRPTSAGSSAFSNAQVASLVFDSANKASTEAEILLDSFLSSRGGYEASLVEDITRKIKKFWSGEGPTDFVLSTTTTVAESADLLVGKLPIDDERRKNNDQRS